MKRIWFKAFSAALVLALLLGLFQSNIGTVQAISANIVISQVYGGGGNSGATYKNDFIELYNLGSSPVDITGWSVQYASSTGITWAKTSLSGTIQPGKYYLIQEAVGAGGTVDLPTPNATGTITMSGTAGKVALVDNSTALTGACPTGLVDFVGYGSATNCFEGAPTANLSNTTAALRNGNGATDTDNNAADFTIGAPNPRNTPPVPTDSAPSVTSTVPANGGSAVPLDTNLSVTFSEPVTLTDGWFTLSCSVSGAHSAAVAGGSDTYTLDPDADLAVDDDCSLTILAAQVADQDVLDPPDNLAANVVVNFSTTNVCTKPFTSIPAIQGSGSTAAITGSVTTQGVVVGDYEGASPTLRGFYLQTAAGDGDAATSDGIFVFNGNNNSVSLGDVVVVSGTAEEYQGQTQISSVTSIVACDTTTVAPVDVTLPFASADDAERYEGMLVRLPQTMYVTEHFQLGRFGEVLLSPDARLQQPTNVLAPGAEADALQAANNLNQILVDDATNAQNPDPIVFGRGGQPLSAANTLRGGDTATGITGILTYTWGGNAASPNAYRVRPINAQGGVINFEPSNPRPTAAPANNGRLRVVGMNLLNFFNTFADKNTNTPGCFPSGTDADCRGAESQLEYGRQLAKTVAAMVGTQADVIGVIEVENDGYGPDSALQALVNQLNAVTAPGTYAFIDVDAATGQLHALGTDAIKVGLLYKPAKVTPVGATAALNSVEFVNGGDPAPRNRPALAQAFEENGTGARFVVSVNHLKSKGSACAAPDAGDGQANCNQVRLNAANLLAAWLASDPTGTGDPDALILGDLNSYAMEDPITALKGAGYTDLIRQFIGADAYSYVFDGQWGYLDHALSNASLVPQVAGVSEWHINADEPSVLDYNTNFKSAGQITSFYAPDEFRISDHDPVLVDLNLDNVSPSIGAISAPADPVKLGTAISASAAFTDPGVLDTHTATWNWGDGSETAGTVTETNGSGSVSDSHTYSAAGVYTITLTVTDNVSAAASASYNYVIVYNPNNGFVNGSGWFNSPAGAYPAKPNATGKVPFSFAAKYVKSAATPTGLTTFSFGAGGLNFASTSNDWLVISGTWAQLQGRGTINGQGDYTFQITTVDARKDTIRIKVWDTATGAVVYDTQMGAAQTADPTTAISGSITVHK